MHSKPTLQFTDFKTITILCGYYCSIIHTLIRKYFGGNISKNGQSGLFYQRMTGAVMITITVPSDTLGIPYYYGQWSICSLGAAAPLSTISSKYSKTNF